MAPSPRSRARRRAGSSARRATTIPLALAWLACAPAVEVEPAPPTLSELIAAIPRGTDEDEGIGRTEQHLATGLAAHGASAVQALLPLLDDPDASVRTFAGYAIRETEAAGPAELERLIAASERSAGWLPVAIAHVGTPRAYEHLVVLLEREPEQGQSSAGLAHGGTIAARALADRLGREPPVGEDFAHELCRVFGALSDAAAPSLPELLAVATSTSTAAENRVAAVRAIGCIGPRSWTVEAALLRLDVGASPELHAAIGAALVGMGSEHAVGGLVAGLDGDSVRENLWLLAKAGPSARAAVPAILELLEGEEPKLRTLAARCLGRIGGRESVPPLLRALQERVHPPLVAAAAIALAELDAREAVPALTTIASEHWQPGVRAVALRAAETLQGLEPLTFPADRLSFMADALADCRGRARPPPAERRPGPGVLQRSELDGLRYEVEVEVERGWPATLSRVPLRDTPVVGLRLEDALLFGGDRGEFSGELVLRRVGRPDELLLRTNVVGLHRTGMGVLVVTGLAHGTESKGALYRFDLDADGRPLVARVLTLPCAARSSGLLPDGSLHVGTDGGDVSFSPDGAVEYLP